MWGGKQNTSWLISQDGGRVERLPLHGTVGLSRRQHAIMAPILVALPTQYWQNLTLLCQHDFNSSQEKPSWLPAEI